MRYFIFLIVCFIVFLGGCTIHSQKIEGVELRQNQQSVLEVNGIRIVIDSSENVSLISDIDVRGNVFEVNLKGTVNE